MIDVFTEMFSLKQADLFNKTDFDNKLTSFNKQIISNKIKHLEVQKEVNSLITNDYSFFLGRIYFTRNDRSQTKFVYQPAHDDLEFFLKKQKILIMFLDGSQMGYLILNLSHCILHSCLKFSGYKTGIRFDKDPLTKKLLDQNCKCFHCL